MDDLAIILDGRPLRSEPAPAFTSSNTLDLRGANAKLMRQRCGVSASLVRCSDSQHLLGAEFCEVKTVSILGRHVSIVVPNGAKKQMVGSHACRHVAFMENALPGRNVAKVDSPRYLMRFTPTLRSVEFKTDGETPIASIAKFALPQPAAVALLDVPPEPFFEAKTRVDSH